MTAITLNPDRFAHQPIAVDAVCRQLGPGGRALLCAPCGSGKTRIAALVATVLAAGGSALILVPTLDLAEQCRRRVNTDPQAAAEI